ncbi:MAG: hypothetical protein GTO60_16580 [Gammaproteobacteria bacterium]|nr:hypothetical protein [Gammaproteobacteria bacterium]
MNNPTIARYTKQHVVSFVVVGLSKITTYAMQGYCTDGKHWAFNEDRIVYNDGAEQCHRYQFRQLHNEEHNHD